MAALVTKLVWLKSPLLAGSSPLQMSSWVMERVMIIAYTNRLLVTGFFFLEICFIDLIDDTSIYYYNN